MEYENGDVMHLYESSVTFNDVHRYCTEIVDHGRGKSFIGYECHDAIRTWREYVAYTSNQHNFTEAQFLTYANCVNLEICKLERDKDFRYVFTGKRVIDGKMIRLKAWTLNDLYTLFNDAIRSLNIGQMIEDQGYATRHSDSIPEPDDRGTDTQAKVVPGSSS
jgi:hypothetical protein